MDVPRENKSPFLLCSHPLSVPCQLCWLSDQSSLWRAGRLRNFLLTTINANTSPVPSLRLFQELNVLLGKGERENVITLYPGWQNGWDLSKPLKLHSFNWLIYGVDLYKYFFFHSLTVKHDL